MIAILYKSQHVPLRMINGIVMGIFAKKKKWTLTIQEGLPDDIYMKAAHAGLGLGWTRKTWQFDKNENQQHILEIMNPILEKWRGMVVFGQSR
nr:hypothetical protein [uncultured Prevotella sp.]